MDWFKSKLFLVIVLVVIFLIASEQDEESETVTENFGTIKYFHLLFVDNQLRRPDFVKNILLFTRFINTPVIKH
jgi:hypothetical protein